MTTSFGGKPSILGPQVVRRDRLAGFVASAGLGQARSDLPPGQAATAQGVEISQARTHRSAQRDTLRLGPEPIHNRLNVLTNVHVARCEAKGDRAADVFALLSCK
ncbi:hypothetical protein [Bradyrhizobium japonicum]|nr:hypothetical protein [Bradyrhizobium japonicum]MCD9110647.1 hypothetical protein [Bradyrhizobium japonicum]MCD9258870.1 hypothetical protein [Bradyrhizobium japonicum SEMIA 5079]MCD9823057.1 hypothetical protein [Bradyrhizobium japonicum]MCD9895311.1 hypothetical protein [Bradyrhizobium japonicum]MCD9911069.1 hypothetical protein [Bradyrhizobium japonicum]